MPNTALNILLVEDDDVAAEAVMRNLQKSAAKFPIIVASNGREALEVLRGSRADRRIRKPFVILLDLNMPIMNGFDFLKALRADERLRDSVVFVLTTSGSDEDRTRAYRESIAGYMIKSAVGPQFSKLTQLLIDYRSAVELP